MAVTALVLLCSMSFAAEKSSRKPDHSKVPGVVIDYIPAKTGKYIGSPSIAVLGNGDYVASHDFFGPRAGHTKSASSVVFSSNDKGRTWQKTADIKPLFWGKLFVHRNKLYIIGVKKEYGDVLIRRSEDGGKTWTNPDTPATGLLCKGSYHCAPMPVVVHNGRIWRSFELAEGKRPNWSALGMSAPIDANLLDAKNWRMSKPLHHGRPKFRWIEGNIVVTPEGTLVNILRTNPLPPGIGADKAAIVHVSDDGRELSHDPKKDIIDFPGGGAKFTIRYDKKTRRYWCIGNKQTNPRTYRNIVVLTSSSDLRNWKVQSIILRHADNKKHAWQYWDWLFEGDDIIAVSRTAYDDGLGGANRAHDANYLTFHRIKNFRKRTMKDPPLGKAQD